MTMTYSGASSAAAAANRMHVLANGDIVDCGRLPPTARNNLYKTELCKHFTETGMCRYGSKCQFAHGEEELRGVLRHPKYKTTKCKAFMNTGRCMYGSRCRFIHTNGPEDEGSDSQSSTSSEADEYETTSSTTTTTTTTSTPDHDLMVNPYSNGLDPVDLAIPFGGLKRVTLTPLTSINSSVASPPDFDAYLFRDPFADGKLGQLDSDVPTSTTSSVLDEEDEDFGSGSETESAAARFSRLSIFQRICREE